MACIAQALYPSENQKNVSSAISKVTVFLSGAQVTGISDVSLQPGMNTVVIGGLSPYIDEQSLQVKGKGKFTVLSASLDKNYISGLEENAESAVLRKKIEELGSKIEDEKLQTGILREEESFLIVNKDAGGKNESLDAANFKTLFEFYKTSLTQIRTDILTRDRRISDMQKELEKLKSQLENLQSRENTPSGQVTVILKAETAATGTVELSYLVQGAGWYPSYDVRIDNLTDPVSLIYKANVFQNTGVDWKNVKLTFSNATPSQGGNVPWLYPWYLDFMQENVYSYQRMDKKAADAAPEAMASGESLMIRGVASLSAPAGFTASTNTTSIEFNVDIPYTVETGSKSKTIDMMYLELPASFEFQAVPKLDPAAFLVAQVRDWQKYQLLEGEANLYFENTLVGRSSLNLGMISDTMNLSLGRDQGIAVKREKRTEFTTERVLGSNRIVTRSWMISVRNNKKEAIKIKLSDQIPVSQNKDIEVEAEELSRGSYNPVSGEVNWTADLPAGQEKTFILTYTVKYPKNSKVIVE